MFLLTMFLGKMYCSYPVVTCIQCQMFFGVAIRQNQTVEFNLNGSKHEHYLHLIISVLLWQTLEIVCIVAMAHADYVVNNWCL